MRFLVLLACLAAVACGEKARFDNYVVYRVVPATEQQVVMLQSLQEFPDGLSFWTEANRIGDAVDIMVPPHLKPRFTETMVRLNIKTEVFIENVQERIDNENPENAPKAMDWTSYHRIDEIYTWLDELAAQYPTIVQTVIGGSTFEGRQIKGVKVSFGTNKPGVFIEGGIHAREWIAPATVTFMLNEILSNQNAAFRASVEAYDWYVFPSANPDGYEYTQTDRMWRKTRSVRSGLVCVGADPNRNWAFHWGGGGSSSNSCSDTFMGVSAFSEIETQSLANYITSVSSKINIYLAFHSYSQYILIPYGLERSVAAIDDFPQHQAVGNAAAAALQARFGTVYTVGNIVDLLYVASGGSMDWVKGTYNTDITFTFELRDTGNFGFILPAAQIIPTGQETMDAVLSIINDAKPAVTKNKLSAFLNKSKKH